MEFAGRYETPFAFLVSHEALPAHVTLEPLFAALREPGRSEAEIRGTDPEAARRRKKPSPKRVGRKVSQVNQVLRAFKREQTSRTYQPPKLENVRYRVMRTLKKVLRRLEKGKPPGNKALLAVNFASPPVAAAFDRFQEFSQYQAEAIREFYEVSNGPKVDKGRMKGEKESRFFTYNNSYMMHIFAKAKIRLVYRLFVDFVFTDNHPSSLNNRFNIWCCKNSLHDDACHSKWKAFRVMLDQYLGTNLPEEIKMERTPEIDLSREIQKESEMAEMEG